MLGSGLTLFGGRSAPRPHLDHVAAYAPGKPIEELERELGITHAIKLASNENPIGPSPKARRRRCAPRSADAHRYADMHAFALRARLAAITA